jgi:TolB protein
VVGVYALWQGRSDRDELPEFTPRQITSHPAWDGEPALSPDGSLIAFVSERSGNKDLWLVDARGGEPLQLTTEEGSDHSPAWYPDGCCIAFVSDRTGESAVWKLPRLGGSATLLLADATDPAISPDGTRIAFARAGANGLLRIGVAPLDDTNSARILTGDDHGLWSHERPAWSPDGQTLCYCDLRHLWTVPSAGGAPRQVTSGDGTDREPAWSPDGRHIYFASHREGTEAIWRLRVDDGSTARVTLGAGPEQAPRLSQDGRRLVYATETDEHTIAISDERTNERSSLRSTRTQSGPAIAPDNSAVVFMSEREHLADLWVQPLLSGRPDGPPRRLTRGQGSSVNPAISPDGRWVAFHNVREGQRDIWVVPLEGGPPRQITTDPAVDVVPRWSPDGSRLSFVSNRSGAYEIWVTEVEDGRQVGTPQQVTSTSGNPTVHTWAPDGSRIFYMEETRADDNAQIEADVWVIEQDGGARARRLTQGAGAIHLCWDRRSGRLLVLGRWGEASPSVRAVDPVTGESHPFAAVRVSDPSWRLLDVTSSLDGRLRAWTETKLAGDIWLLTSATATF